MTEEEKKIYDLSPNDPSVLEEYEIIIGGVKGLRLKVDPRQVPVKAPIGSHAIHLSTHFIKSGPTDNDWSELVLKNSEILWATKMIGSEDKIFVMSEDYEFIKKMQYDDNEIFRVEKK